MAVICICMLSQEAIAQSMAIGEAGLEPVPSAMLDVVSTEKGMLIPRMTQSERNSISSPANGLLVYQIDNEPGIYIYKSGSSSWIQLLDTDASVFALDGVLSNGNNANNQNILNVDSMSIGFGSAQVPLGINDFFAIDGTNASGLRYIGGNVYYNGSDFRYIQSDQAGILGFGSGSTTLGHFASGTANTTVPNASTSISLEDSTVFINSSASDTNVFLVGQTISGQLNVTSNLTVGPYTLPIIDGTNGYTLTTDGSGTVSWQDPGDDLGDHVADQNLQLGSFFMSKDGDNEGIAINSNGVVTIEGATAGATNLAVNGDIETNGQGYGIHFNSANLSILGDASGNGHMTFQSSGNERMRIESGGDVGIGTNDPSALLHVHGNGVPQVLVEPSSNTSNDGQITIRGARNTSTSSQNASIVFENYDDDISSTGFLGRISGYVTDATANTGDMVFYTSTNGSTETEAMRIDDDGNVGIGITTPPYPLTLSTSGSTDMYLNTGAVGDTSRITFGYNSTANSIGQIRAGNGFLQLAAANNRDIIFLTKGSQSGSGLEEGTDVEEIMRVDGNGNVGVGSNAPEVKFHVDGGSDASLTDGSGYLLVGSEGSTNIVMDNNEIMARSNGGETNLHLQADGGGLSIQSSQGGNTQVIIQDDGDVGIGESSPQASLDVHDVAVIGNISVGSESSFQAASSSQAGDGFLTTPWIYTNAIEAQGERGTGSVAITVGNDGNFGANDEIHFITSGTDAAYFNSAREFILGNSGSAQGLLVVAKTGGDFQSGIQLNDESTNDWYIFQNGSQEFVFRDDAADRVKIDANGNWCPASDNSLDLGTSSLRWDDVYATNGSIQTSDIRFKTNLKPLEYGLEEVMELEPVHYQWKDDTTEHKIGFVAQDVKEIIPEVVNVGDDSLQTLGMRYADMIPVLVSAIQTQQEQLDQLKNENKAVKEELILLKQQMMQREEQDSMHEEFESRVSLSQVTE